jgi:hypothetical protein
MRHGTEATLETRRYPIPRYRFLPIMLTATTPFLVALPIPARTRTRPNPVRQHRIWLAR